MNLAEGRRITDFKIKMLILGKRLRLNWCLKSNKNKIFTNFFCPSRQCIYGSWGNDLHPIKDSSDIFEQK